MNTIEADTVLEILSGYWPTPALTDEEVKAWYAELCGSHIKITTEEAGKVIAIWARSGEEWRLRPGQIVAEAQALRRRRVLDRPVALPEPVGGADYEQVRADALAQCRVAIDAGAASVAAERACRRSKVGSPP